MSTNNETAWFLAVRRLSDERDEARAEVERLRAVIDDTAKAWQGLNGLPPVPFEGAIDGAMRAAVKEVERLRAAQNEVAVRELEAVLSNYEGSCDADYAFHQIKQRIAALRQPQKQAEAPQPTAASEERGPSADDHAQCVRGSVYGPGAIPGGGATFDDAPLREFLDWFNKHKPSWMPQAAISELCRRALAGRTQP